MNKYFTKEYIKECEYDMKEKTIYMGIFDFMGFKREIRIQEPTPSYAIPILLNKISDKQLIFAMHFYRHKLIRDITNNLNNTRIITFEYIFDEIRP